uniref:phage integrase SAM-like domain-containing protein n=1 Tax=Flavobacterium sp. TaxID=239 RepID=UPI003B9B4B07
VQCSNVQKMATISFRIRSNANKNVSITVVLSQGRGKTLEAKTGFSVNPKNWGTGKPKQNNTTENKQLRESLLKLETYLNVNLNGDLSNGILIDNYWLQAQISSCFNRVEKVDKGLIINHIQYIIDNAKTRKIAGTSKIGISDSRVKSYQTFKKVVEDYQKELKKQIHFLDVNKPFVDKFINWLMNERKYSTNYAGKIIDNLKTVGLDAEKNEINVNPYIKQIEGFSESNDDRYIVTLSFAELEKIRTANIENPALENARRWILLGCEIGQRGGDLLAITKDDFRYNTNGNIYLDVTQKKTGKTVTIPIVQPHIIEIIKYNFPHKISSQRLNEYIKKVCELSGINELVKGKKLNPNASKGQPETMRKVLADYPKHELITTHSFRRSFATNYYKLMPTAILIAITGHSKESLFLQYINAPEDKDANADLFRKFYEQINHRTAELRAV